MSEIIRIPVAQGVNLNIIPTDRFKTGYFSINLIRQLDRREAARNALVPYVLKRGCRAYPDMGSLGARLCELYGARLSAGVRKKGEAQILGLGIEFLDDRYALAGEKVARECVELLTSMLLEPLAREGAFLGEYVEGEKKNLEDLIDARVNDKVQYAIHRCLELMCRDEAFGASELGLKEDIGPIGAQSLYEHYQALLEDSRLELFYIGGADMQELSEQISAVFSGLRRLQPSPVITRVVRRSERVRREQERMHVGQAKLSLGFRTGVSDAEDGYAALALMNAVYGFGATSKLFANVREKLSLCYYCSSRLEPHKGLMVVSSGVDRKNAERAEKEILAQLDDIRGGRVSDEEMEAAVKGLTNLFRSAADSPGALEDWYLGQTVGGAMKTLEQREREISAVRKEDVVRAAAAVTLDTVYLLGPEDGGAK